MKKILKTVKFFLFISLLSTSSVLAVVNKITPERLKKIETAIVTINTRLSVSAYGDLGSTMGTGFITDKKNGLIITNRHVIGGPSVGTYFVTFHNGQQVQAKLIYYDLWQDYAILKIDYNEIPASAGQILFAETLGGQSQNVFVIGSSGGQDFSFHDGFISTFYEIDGNMPQCSFVISLNSADGASGSPVLNINGEAIGVIYGVGKTFALALHGQYVQYALDSIKKATIPSRKHVGILCELYSLNKAVRHRHFPKERMEEYIKKFPDSRNKAIAVRSIIAGSPAEGFMKSGDIIWEINGKLIGGNLATLDFAMNNAVDNKIKLTIYRDGQKMALTAQLYDINSNKIERMVRFAGAVFFQADDIASARSGIPLNSLTIKNVQGGSSFSTLPINYNNSYRLVITSIDEKNIHNLDELISIIPAAIKKKFISMRLKNHQDYMPSYQSTGYSFISGREDLMADIDFDSTDNKPYILKYKQELNEWQAEDIIVNP